ERDIRINLIEAVDAGRINHHHTRGLGEQIGTPREGAVHMHPFTGNRRRQFGSRGVLGYVTRLDAGYRDGRDPGGLERRDIGIAYHTALLEHEATLADRMDDDAALRVARCDRAEFHLSISAERRSADSRSDAVISAMMATAISGGDAAPMASPIGAWMRDSAASVTPCALSRSSRRALVFLEPSAPI